MHKKVAIVTAHFMAEMSYMEVKIAETLGRLGFESHVIASTKPYPFIQKNTQDFKEGFDNSGNGYNIVRKKPVLSHLSNVLARDLSDDIFSLRPDYVFVIGVAKLFPDSVYKLYKKYNIKIITFFGENPDQYPKGCLKIEAKRFIIRRIFKQKFYNKAVRRSDYLVLYTPATYDALKRFVGKKVYPLIKQKIVNSTLGYDELNYFNNYNERVLNRNKLNISQNAKVAITVTRIVAGKNIEKLIDIIDEINSSGYECYYCLVGLMGDEYGDKVVKYTKNKTNFNKFIFLPFQNSDRIRQLFNMADIGIWTQAAITIQEAMGTGLPVCIPNSKVLSHLLKENINGWYYNKNNMKEEIINILINDINSNINRADIEHYNQSILSWKTVVNSIMAEIEN